MDIIKLVTQKLKFILNYRGKNMKQIVLKQNGYYIDGKSVLNLWGGGLGEIEMQPFHVNSLREIREKINDNGFGCESIEWAHCHIHRNYSDGNHNVNEYARTILIK